MSYTAGPTDNVYQCASVTTNYPTDDWALMVLDRMVTPTRPPLNVRYNAQVALNDPMTIMIAGLLWPAGKRPR